MTLLDLHRIATEIGGPCDVHEGDESILIAYEDRTVELGRYILDEEPESVADHLLADRRFIEEPEP